MTALSGVVYDGHMDEEKPRPLCPPCRAARAAWLDYRLPQVHGFTFGSGTPYDVSLSGIRDRRHARFEQWRSTIRFNRDLIARTCREAGHVADESPARVIQLDLLAMAEAGKAVA